MIILAMPIPVNLTKELQINIFLYINGDRIEKKIVSHTLKRK